MIELRDIHYTRIGTQDLDAAERFATQIMGLEMVAGRRIGCTCAVITGTTPFAIFWAIPPSRFLRLT